MNYYNPFSHVKSVVSSGFVQRFKDSFYAIFGYHNHSLVNPLHYLDNAYNTPAYSLAAYSSFNAYEDKNKHLGIYDYLTFMLPLALEKGLAWFCESASSAIGKLFRFIDAFTEKFPLILRAPMVLLSIIAPPLLSLAICVLPFTLNVILHGLRALCGAALSLLSAPFVAAVHLFSLWPLSGLKRQADQFQAEGDELTLGDHLLFAGKSLNDVVVKVLSTASIELAFSDNYYKSFISGKPKLDQKNSTALKALYEMNLDNVKERFMFFEKQHLDGVQDRYTEARKNCLKVSFVEIDVNNYESSLNQFKAEAMNYKGIDLSGGLTNMIDERENSYKAGRNFWEKGPVENCYLSFIKAIPKNVRYLDLSHNHLNELAQDDVEHLDDFIKAVPSHVKAINLGFNGFTSRLLEHLTRYFRSNPSLVRKIDWEDQAGIANEFKMVRAVAGKEILDEVLLDHCDVLPELANIVQGYVAFDLK